MRRVLMLKSWKGASFQESQAHCLTGCDVRLEDCSQSFSLFPRRHQISRCVARIKKNLGAWRPDIIHAHAAYPAGAVALLLKSEWNAPVVLTEHTGPIMLLEKYFDSAAVFYQHYNQYDAVIAVSQFLKTQLLAKNSSLDIKVIGNVVRDEFFNSPLTAPLQRNSALLLGRLTDDKGIPELLVALKKIKQPLNLHAVGDGDLRQQLGSIRIPHISIALHAPAENSTQVMDHINRSSFLVLPSRIETFSLVSAEALALGRPVLSFRGLGPDDFIDDQCGLLVERGADAFARGIEALISQERWSWNPRSAEMRRETIRRKFSSVSIGDQILQVYQRLAQ